MGLKELLALNRPVVKQLFLEIPDPRISRFLAENSYALGLAPAAVGNGPFGFLQ